jgi:uncharacterized repeat protein (TIGR01451 family)
MKRNRVTALLLSLAMLAGLWVSANAVAHPVTVNGTIEDWFETSPITKPGAYPSPNTGQVARNSTQQGEYIWRDTFRDQRVIATTTITRDVDLRTFRATADETNLYLYLNVDSVINLSGGKAPEFQVALDTAPGGNTNLIGDAATINSNAAWEYLVQTRFSTNGVSGTTTNSVAPLVHAAAGGNTNTGTSGVLKSAGVDTAELKIPWSLIGGAPPSAGKRLRFTVATFYSDRTNAADSVANGSAVMDTVHRTQSAETDLVDGQLDYYVDAYFGATGEVFSPLLITEFQPNAIGPDNISTNDTEWIEIYNTSTFSVELGGYKAGDAAKRIPSGAEGMFQFPAATLDPGKIVILANNKAKFNANYPGVAANPNVTVYGVAEGNVTKYSSWAGGNVITMLDGPSAAATSFQEEVVLLDGNDTIVDIATYISSVFPNSASHPGVVPITFQGNLVPESRSYERCPASRDTNDASFDFIAHEGKAAQTPGLICDGMTALLIAQATQSTVAVAGQIDYTLTYANSGASAVDVYITDTLPLNVSYVAGSQVANPVFGTSPIVFTDLGSGKLQWKLPRVGAGAGTISFSAQVGSGVPPGENLVNTAVIAGPLADANAADNTSSATTTVTATSLADVGIAKALTSPPEFFYTGRSAVYTLTYSNSGDLPAMNTVITDTIPAGLTFVSASRTPAIADSSKLVFNVGTVSSAVDQTIEVTFMVTAPAAGGMSIANTATIGTATSPEPVKGNNTATATHTTVAVPPVDLALTKTANTGTMWFGGAITYELAVTNVGGGTASGIQVVDTLPAGLAYKPGSSSAAAGEPAISSNGRTLTWNLPAGFTVGTGATRAFQFQTTVLKGNAGAALVNSAVVNLAGDANAQNNAASSEPTIVSGAKVYMPLIVR